MLPAVAGAVAFVAGAVNLVSAVTPNLSWRGRLVLQFLPVSVVPLLHTLAVPASIALVVTAFYLRRRRRRALHGAVGLLVVLGALNLFKGLDFEEAALSFAGAAALWWGRASFYVAPAVRIPAKLVAVAAGVLGGTLGITGYLVWTASGETAQPHTILSDTLDMLAWTHPSVTFYDELGMLPWAIGSVTVTLILLAAWALFRPLAPSHSLPAQHERQAARDLVRRHGSDTLAYFKLRRDTQYLFSADGRAFLGYRIEGSVMVVSGDPLGPDDALPGLVRSAFSLAEVHDLRLSVLGASERTLPLWRGAGLRQLYIGDEAIVQTAQFSLQGRAIRKVRQAVARVAKAGYTAEVVPLRQLGNAELAELERVSACWRAGKAERGFTMAMDRLRPSECDSLVVLARDREGRIRGFLQFVPSYGRPAMSLSFMRRDRSIPNGATEFLVVRAIELLRERGVEELSLNFAAFGRLLERPSGRLERLLGRLLVIPSRYFQIESLYRFNAKFSPRWEPRYFLFGSLLGLPRAGLAALLLEGHLPRLRPAAGSS